MPRAVPGCAWMMEHADLSATEPAQVMMRTAHSMMHSHLRLKPQTKARVEPYYFYVTHAHNMISSLRTLKYITAVTKQIVRRPVSMICLELCMHDADCQAVGYRSSADQEENCSLYDEHPPENTLRILSGTLLL